VPLSVKSAESVAGHTSILEYMPRSPLADAYREVAGAIIAAGDRETRPAHV
jgi:chromosome partitioning protein